MNIEQKLEQLLDHSGESEVVEFKEAKNSYNFDKLGKYFSALSNEANLKKSINAWLLFGVKNDQTVVGTNYYQEKKGLQSLKKKIADKTTNRLTFAEIYEVDHADGRVILFKIPKAPRGIPVAWEGNYYGRDGESLGSLNIEEIERIRTYDDWSVKTCGATLEDLDNKAIQVARQEYAKKNPNLAAEIQNWNDETFLNKAKLTIEGQVTRTAIILLGKPESSHWLNPSSATISWILKDRHGLELDYENFSCPLLISVEQIFRKIRNLKYRYMAESTLFPEEVDQYDPYIIREALNNAIAHQDYEACGKITVIEFQDGRLCFSNLGSFIPGTIEKVIKSDAPESRYRNLFLSDAMVKLNMIDTIGSGIRKMFNIQKDRFFPLPEYEIDNDRVQVTITGSVLDINYARKLAQMPDLSLDDIILLDRVQKHKSLTDTQIKHLRQQNLIEGLDNQHYKQLIREYIERFGKAKRANIDMLILAKLPDVLDENQKKNKVRNLLQSLKNEGVIKPEGKMWQMSET